MRRGDGVQRVSKSGLGRRSYTAGSPSTSTETLDPDNFSPPRVHDRPQVKSIVRRTSMARALDEV